MLESYFRKDVHLVDHALVLQKVYSLSLLSDAAHMLTFSIVIDRLNCIQCLLEL